MQHPCVIRFEMFYSCRYIAVHARHLTAQLLRDACSSQATDGGIQGMSVAAFLCDLVRVCSRINTCAGIKHP